MSKQELQEKAFQNSGYTYEQSLEATTHIRPSIYERLGNEEGILKLSQLFYDRVFDMKDNQWFLNIFSSSSKAEAVENQYLFFVQTFGGPNLYKEKKGKYTRLAGRHAAYNIGTNAARLWVRTMIDAMEDHDALSRDDMAKEVLVKYFSYTAHYIVAAMEYMKKDQLSGGTSIDTGRIW